MVHLMLQLRRRRPWGAEEVEVQAEAEDLVVTLDHQELSEALQVLFHLFLLLIFLLQPVVLLKTSFTLVCWCLIVAHRQHA